MIRRLVLVAAIALVAVPSASAHAIVTRISPPNGAVLTQSPTVVRVTFDSPVRPGPHNAAVRADLRSVLAGVPHVRSMRSLLIPLRPNLGAGDYTVRWSVVSEDGHEQEGLIAFAVGAGSPTPKPVLTVEGFETWQRVVMRALFFAGVLGGAGSVVFTLLVLMPLGLEESLRRQQAHLFFAFCVSAFCGADALAHTAGAAGTRFEHLMVVAAFAAGIGAFAAALTPLFERLRYAAWLAAGVLLPCPTFAGHALDASQPRIVAPLADLLHVGGAAIWVGGAASLCALLTRVPSESRAKTISRFSTVAAPAVVLVAVAGTARALTELGAFSQLWSTGYGRGILAKSSLFLVALVLVRAGRSILASGTGRARRLLAFELTLLTAIVIALGILTDLRPGVAAPPPTAATAYSGAGSSLPSSR